MSGSTSTSERGLLQSGLGYLIDQSQPPLVFAAIHGVGEVLEHVLSTLEQHGRDVSPIVLESHSRTVSINLYEPEPLTVQIVQEDGPLERATEILGAGIGLGVLSEVRRTVQILGLELAPLTEHFLRRLSNEMTTYVQSYQLFRGDADVKRARFSQVLRGLHDKHRRDASLLRQLL